MFVRKIWFTNSGRKMVVAGRRTEIAYTVFTLVPRGFMQTVCSIYAPNYCNNAIRFKYISIWCILIGLNGNCLSSCRGKDTTPTVNTMQRHAPVGIPVATF